MTVAGAVIAVFVIPMLIGQLIYALTRGKPAASRDHTREEDRVHGSG